MKASIIISTDSNKTLFENFIYFLSKYRGINDYEIIVVIDSDDFLFDESLFESYGIENIKIVNPKIKLGYSAANNLAATHATSDILVFINDDIILKDNCLELLINTLQMEQVGAVQPKLIYPQSKLIQSTGHTFTKYTNSHALENSSSESPVVNKNYIRNALTTAVCATKKELFFRMGGFDTVYYNAWEGMEYTLKLTSEGYMCIYEHKAEAYHIRGGARSGYLLDESAQSALFWSKWSSKIKADLHEIIMTQLTEEMVDSEYILINLSKITNSRAILENCGLKVLNEILYTFNSGLKYVDFLKTIPTRIISSDKNIIYFTNNFTQVKNNYLWFELRKTLDDLIIDLCGNIVKCNDLLPNS